MQEGPGPFKKVHLEQAHTASLHDNGQVCKAGHLLVEHRIRFDMSSTTSPGQLLARRLVEPIVRVISNSVIEYQELPQRQFGCNVHNEETGEYRVLSRGAVAWPRGG